MGMGRAPVTTTLAMMAYPQKKRPGSEEPGKSNREASRLGDVGSEDPCLSIALKPRLATEVAEMSHVLRRNTVANLDKF